MTPQLKPLHRIWGSHEGYVWIGHKNALGEWRSGEAFRWPQDRGLIQSKIFRLDEQNRDLYFTPGVYRREEHRAGNLLSHDALWADLDEGYDEARLELVKPSMSWRTSEHCRQAVWMLTAAHTPLGLAKQLTTFLHADAGGWHGAKFLRIPGTANTKRGGAWRSPYKPIVSKRVWSAEALMDVVGTPETLSDESPLMNPSDVRPVAPRQLLARLTPAVRAQVMRDDVSGVDRSRLQWRRVCLLIEAGLSLDEVIAVVQLTPLYAETPHRDAVADVRRIWRKRGAR